jgi:hypothetical protein
VSNKPPTADQPSPLPPPQPRQAHRDPSRPARYDSGMGTYMAEGLPRSCPSQPSGIVEHSQSTAEVWRGRWRGG